MLFTNVFGLSNSCFMRALRIWIYRVKQSTEQFGDEVMKSQHFMEVSKMEKYTPKPRWFDQSRSWHSIEIHLMTNICIPECNSVSFAISTTSPFYMIATA